MTMTDPIADFLTRLRNANSAYHDEVTLPHSKIKANIAEILKAEGYITDYRTEDARVGKSLVVNLKYGPTRERSIAGLSACPSPVCGCTRSPPTCLGCWAALAWRSSPRPRVCSPTVRQHDKAWAAKSSLTCGEGELDMSRIGKQPVLVPSGVDVTIDGQNVSVKGPKGDTETRRRRADLGLAQRRRRHRGDPSQRRAAQPFVARTVPHLGGQPHHRCHRGVHHEDGDLRRRLPRRSSRARPSSSRLATAIPS